MGKYVAFIDILGFKDMIRYNSHEEMVGIFDNFRIYVQRSLADDKIISDSTGRHTYDMSNSKINSNIISDSIIFWTNENKTSDFFELVNCLHSFTSFCHNYPKLFLRGGITYGDFFYDNNGILKGRETISIHPMMFGIALVDVFEIEKTLELSGYIITNKAIEEAQKNDNDLFKNKWKQFIDERKLVEYQMPTKKGSIKYWTINWVREGKILGLEEITTAFSSFKKRTADKSVKIKIENTASYCKFIEEMVKKK